ncbi:MAG: sulfotransferase [Candidatus Lokiarchaeota archaeon]|nr:sulfotransferase [Candidatus Lokiarchaeota archaeon]
MVLKQKDDSWKIISKEPMGSYSLRNIFLLLFLTKFHISLKYIPRLIWALSLSFITFPMRLIESIRFDNKIKKTQVIKDPIFIVGFYRTGTTFIHILFSKDPQFGFMSNLDCFMPLYNLTFENLARKVFLKLMPKTRPMDNLKLIVGEPQEEHYAVASKSQFGILNALIFPKKFSYFTRFLSFENCTERELSKWKSVYHYFVQKTTLKHDGKQLILKNPANAARIKYLLEMYPNAKFIYSYRNPYTLYPSMKVFFKKLLEIFTLQSWDENEIDDSFLKLFNTNFRLFQDSKKLIPPNNYYELQYEKFIENPLRFLEEIYEKFQLKDFESVKSDFLQHIRDQSDYKPNTHKIDRKVIETVNSHLDRYRTEYGYGRLDPK